MKTVVEAKHAIFELSEAEQAELFAWLETSLGMREMVEQVTRLTQCYAIWRELSDPHNAQLWREVKEQYYDFLEPIWHVLLWQGFFVIYYQLFDQRPDSKHIHLRVDQLARTDARLANSIRAKIKNYAPLAKIKRIRHKISAHRD